MNRKEQTKESFIFYLFISRQFKWVATMATYTQLAFEHLKIESIFVPSSELYLVLDLTYIEVPVS